MGLVRLVPLMKGYVTLRELKERLGYKDESALRHAIRAGRLTAERAGYTFIVTDQEAARFADAEPPKRGWPKGKERGPRRPISEEES